MNFILQKDMNKMKQGWEIKKIKVICDKASSNIAQNKITELDGDYPVFGASGFVQNVDFYHRDTDYIGVVKDGSGVGRVNVYPAYSSLLGTLQYILPKEGYALNYVAYALKSLNLASFASGAAIPHIYFKDYGEVEIPVPPIVEQERIVAELDCLSGVIERKREQLKQLDALAQSIFYQMFGDPITNEKRWEVSTIENVCSSIVRGPFGSALKKEYFVEQSNTTYKVYEQKHAIQKDSTIGTYYISADMFETLSRFEIKEGDIIMSCSGTIGKFYEIPIGAEKGIMNQALLKYTLNKNIHKIYFLYVMEWVKENFEKKGSGLQNIGSVKTIKSTDISLPPLTLQQEFADKIEAIEKQKELIKKSISETETLFNARMDYYFN